MRTEHEKWHARHLIGSGELRFHKVCVSLEDVKAEIDASRKREAERGYNPTQYLITHEEVYTWFDESNNFVKRETLEQAIETYPA